MVLVPTTHSSVTHHTAAPTTPLSALLIMIDVSFTFPHLSPLWATLTVYDILTVTKEKKAEKILNSRGLVSGRRAERQLSSDACFMSGLCINFRFSEIFPFRNSGYGVTYLYLRANCFFNL
jgi:hypothetical protein